MLPQTRADLDRDGSVKVRRKDKLVVIDPSHVVSAAKAGFERVSLAMPDPKVGAPPEDIRAIQKREEAKGTTLHTLAVNASAGATAT